MERNYGAATSFLDLLFNALLGFVALFALAFVQINQEKSNKNVEIKGEFLIIITWPEEFDNDVDVYVSDPNGKLVFYREKEANLMNIDRDDIGSASDKVGDIVFKENREIVTLRNTVPGEYIINIHMFNINTYKPTPVRVQIDKINPYATIFNKTIVLERHFEEKTAVRFTLDDKNNVMEINDLHISLIDKYLQGVPGGQVR